MKFITLKIVLCAKFMTPRCKINLPETVYTYNEHVVIVETSKHIIRSLKMKKQIFQPQLMATMFIIGTFA